MRRVDLLRREEQFRPRVLRICLLAITTLFLWAGMARAQGAPGWRLVRAENTGFVGNVLSLDGYYLQVTGQVQNGSLDVQWTLDPNSDSPMTIPSSASWNPPPASAQPGDIWTLQAGGTGESSTASVSFGALFSPSPTFDLNSGRGAGWSDGEPWPSPADPLQYPYLVIDVSPQVEFAASNRSGLDTRTRRGKAYSQYHYIYKWSAEGVPPRPSPTAGPDPGPSPESPPWKIVVGLGAVAAMAVAAAAGPLAAKAAAAKAAAPVGAKKPASKKAEKVDPDRTVGYILQLSANQFTLKAGTPATLTVTIWSVSARGVTTVAGDAQIRLTPSTSPPGLRIEPSSGAGRLQSKLSWAGGSAPTDSVTLLVTAAAGTNYSASVQLNLEMAQIVYEFDGGKSAIRPDGKDSTVLRAKVVLDGAGTVSDEATASLEFARGSEWLDPGQAVIRDHWKVITVHASDPAGPESNRQPPSPVFVTLSARYGERQLSSSAPLELLARPELDVDLRPDKVTVIQGEPTPVKFHAIITNPGSDKWKWSVKLENKDACRVDFKELEMPGVIEISVLPPRTLAEGSRGAQVSTRMHILAEQSGLDPLERILPLLVAREGLLVQTRGRDSEGLYVLPCDTESTKEIDFVVYIKDANGRLVADPMLVKQLCFAGNGQTQQQHDLFSGAKPEIKPPTSEKGSTWTFRSQDTIPGEKGEVYRIPISVHVSGKESRPEFCSEFDLGLKVMESVIRSDDWQRELEGCYQAIRNVPEPARSKLAKSIRRQTPTMGLQELKDFRKKLWRTASTLIQNPKPGSVVHPDKPHQPEQHLDKFKQKPLTLDEREKAWQEGKQQGQALVDLAKQAAKSHDPEKVRDATLDMQANKQGLYEINRQKGEDISTTRTALKNDMQAIYDKTDGKVCQELSKEYGDGVRPKSITNEPKPGAPPKDPSKMSIDRDVTYERPAKVGEWIPHPTLPGKLVRATGKEMVDIPARVSAKVYAEKFKETALDGASEESRSKYHQMTPEQFAKHMDQTVTDRLASDAYGSRLGDLNTAVKDPAGQFSDPEGVGKTAGYKADEWYEKAERDASTPEEHETYVAEGMRQTTKQYGNQITNRLDVLNETRGPGSAHPDLPKVTPPPELKAGIDILQKVTDGRISPATADAELSKIGMTRQDVGHNLGDFLNKIYRIKVQP